MYPADGSATFLDGALSVYVCVLPSQFWERRNDDVPTQYLNDRQTTRYRHEHTSPDIGQSISQSKD